MTTPAIAELLNTHAALIASRELSFDEKVGFLTATAKWAFNSCFNFDAKLLYEIREALRADVSRRLSEASKYQLQREAQRKTDIEHERKPPRDLQADISAEREAIQRIVSNGLHRPNAVENLELHTKRLLKLERKIT